MPKFSKFLLIITLFNLSITKTQALTKTTSTTPSISAEVPSTASPTDTTPPFPPILISPTNHIYLNNPQLNFIWRQTTDLNSNTLTYTLHLNQQIYPNLPSHANLIKTKYHTLAKTNTFTFFLNQPLPDGSYIWYVTAADANQNQANSAIFKFTLDTQPPQLTLNTFDQHRNLNLNPSNTPISLNFNPNLTTHHLTLITEPNALINLTLTNLFNSQSQSFSQTCPPTPNPCRLTFNLSLTSTPHQLQISAFDQAHNSANLPSITLIPIIPSPLPHFLPATLAQLQPTSQNLSLYLLLLLAIILILLLIYKRKRLNFIVVAPVPLKPNIIYLSHLPPHSSKLKTYKLKPNRHYFIPHLQSRSTLTIHLPNQSPPLVLCVLSPSSRYQIRI